MKTTRAFKSGNSTAVRLPKEWGLRPGDELELSADGDRIILTPVVAKSARINTSRFWGKAPGFMTDGRGDTDQHERDWPQSAQSDAA